MQYGNDASSKLTIRADMPVSVSSSAHGANLDAIGFNIAFIAMRKPLLAVELMRLCGEARELTVDTPTAADEDMILAKIQHDLQRTFKHRQ